LTSIKNNLLKMIKINPKVFIEKFLMIVSLKTIRILNKDNLTLLNQNKFLIISNHIIVFHFILAHAAIKIFKIKTFSAAMLQAEVLSYNGLLAINQKEVLKE